MVAPSFIKGDVSRAPTPDALRAFTYRRGTISLGHPAKDHYAAGMDTPVSRGPSRRLSWSWLLLALSILLFVLGQAFPGILERTYGPLFPLIAGLQAGLLSWVPISVSEMALVGLLVLGAFWLKRGLRAFLLGIAWLLPLLGGLGILLWGLNHGRPPISERLGWSLGTPGENALADLVGELVGELNGLEGSFPEEALKPESRDWEQSLTPAFDGQAQQWNWLRGPKVRVRTPLAEGLLARLGIAGVYSPWTGEAHLEGSLPAPLVWHTAAHEAAHQRGIAREGEANFIAWMVLKDAPDPAARYSARFVLLGQAIRALHGQNPERALELIQAMEPALQDRRARVREYWRQRLGVLSKVSHRVNDTYLKAAGHEQGIQSYGLVLDLVLAERR